jgi:hypothetical protein
MITTNQLCEGERMNVNNVLSNKKYLTFEGKSILVDRMKILFYVSEYNEQTRNVDLRGNIFVSRDATDNGPLFYKSDEMTRQSSNEKEVIHVNKQPVLFRFVLMSVTFNLLTQHAVQSVPCEQRQATIFTVHIKARMMHSNLALISDYMHDNLLMRRCD